MHLWMHGARTRLLWIWNNLRSKQKRLDAIRQSHIASINSRFVQKNHARLSYAINAFQYSVHSTTRTNIAMCKHAAVESWKKMIWMRMVVAGSGDEAEYISLCYCFHHVIRGTETSHEFLRILCNWEYESEWQESARGYATVRWRKERNKIKKQNQAMMRRKILRCGAFKLLSKLFSYVESQIKCWCREHYCNGTRRDEKYWQHHTT